MDEVAAVEQVPGKSGVMSVLGGDPAWPVAGLLRSAGLDVLDAEPPPKQITDGMAANYGFGMSSVRAGILGDIRLVQQRLRDAFDGTEPKHLVWTAEDGTCVDALRAAAEPAVDSEEEARALYRAHLEATRSMVLRTDLLILVMRECPLFVDGAGTLFPGPLPLAKPPKGCKTKPAPATVAQLAKAFADVRGRLLAVRPMLKIRLLCPDSEGEHAPMLRALCTRLAEAHDDTLYHPLVDEILARLRKGGADPRLGALLDRIISARDVVEALLAEPVAPAQPLLTKQDKAERKARKEARAKRRNRASSDARVVCEDELLEAFS